MPEITITLDEPDESVGIWGGWYVTFDDGQDVYLTNASDDPVEALSVAVEVAKAKYGIRCTQCFGDQYIDVEEEDGSIRSKTCFECGGKGRVPYSDFSVAEIALDNANKSEGRIDDGI